MKNYVSYHYLCVEDATELALDRPLWRLFGSRWSYALKCLNASTEMQAEQ